MKITIAILAAMALLGCAATPPSEQEIAAVGGYGPPLTIDYQAAIKKWFLTYLKDPLSAQNHFLSAPSKDAVRTSFNEGQQLFAGYQVLVDVNAKNSSGGYTGFESYGFLFRDNRIVNVMKLVSNETGTYWVKA
jgi:hypothetical protein